MSPTARPAQAAPAAAPDEQVRHSRDVILDVAERLMTGQGYDKTSIAAIRRESGLPVGSIYHHFTGKAGILAAVMERWSARFFADIPGYTAGTGDPDARFRAYWSGAIAAIIKEHAAFLLDADLMRLSHSDPELRKVMAQLRTTTQRELEPTFLAFARDHGAADAAGLARRLAVLTEAATRGLILTCGPDLDALRRSMDDLFQAVRASVIAAARD
ncbi:TetR/AcrR family transcriptional regulator [Dactylosporangium siamense]|uniref:HTH tetR-type domain-containing protein n=1 Tax=Dactylosporangium siamense TaxID=685454 RepID=A0A919PNH2_9ACTN|nr:TetR/AcrR family transcriptional regulator [Dactylosporangium siamense]GIG47089.1 hypothetical protein Dsi01nite_051300 [Dactylosporangium siamense]